MRCRYTAPRRWYVCGEIQKDGKLKIEVRQTTANNSSLLSGGGARERPQERSAAKTSNTQKKETEVSLRLANFVLLCTTI